MWLPSSVSPFRQRVRNEPQARDARLAGTEGLFLSMESAPERSKPALQQLLTAFGRLDDQDVDRFIAAGFGKDDALEVIGIVAAPTITNYTGSITKTPLEAPFQAHAWAA